MMNHTRRQNWLRPIPSPLLWLLCFAVIGLSAGPLAAQETPKKPKKSLDPADAALRDSVLYGKEDEVIYATSTLFRKKLDALLSELLAQRKLKTSQRLLILKALAIHGRERPQAACSIIHPRLLDPNLAIRKAARRAIIANEALSPSQKPPEMANSSYAFLKQRLLTLAGDKKSNSHDSEIQLLIDILRDKQNPILAAGVLIEVAKALKGSQRDYARRVLTDITGVESVPDWSTWYARECRRPKSDWHLRRQRYLEAQQQRRLKELNQAALNVFKDFLKMLKSDDTALLNELEKACLHSPILAIRHWAIELLGEHGQRTDKHGQRAFDILLKALGSTRNDHETKLKILEALGATGKKDAAAPLTEFIGQRDRRTLFVVIEALSSLKHEKALAPLKSILTDQLSQSAPDKTLIEKTLQGLELIGLDPEGQVSNAITGVIDAVIKDKNDPPRWNVDEQNTLLYTCAEALGHLDYESAAAAEGALSGLKQIMTARSADIRVLVAFSLSHLRFVDVRPQLKQLIRDEVPRVRKAAVEGLGRIALRRGAPKAERRAIIEQLVELNIGLDSSLQPTARSQLERIIQEDFKRSLGNLTLVTEAFDKRKSIDHALPFLLILKKENGLGKDRALRYSWLIEARARARLAAAATASKENRRNLLQAALKDTAELLANPQNNTAKARLLRLEARTRLMLGEAKKAAELLTPDIGQAESAGLWCQALTSLKKAGKKQEVASLIQNLPKKGLGEKVDALLKDLKAWLKTKTPAKKSP